MEDEQQERIIRTRLGRKWSAECLPQTSNLCNRGMMPTTGISKVHFLRKNGIYSVMSVWMRKTNLFAILSAATLLFRQWPSSIYTEPLVSMFPVLYIKFHMVDTDRNGYSSLIKYEMHYLFCGYQIFQADKNTPKTHIHINTQQT